ARTALWIRKNCARSSMLRARSTPCRAAASRLRLPARIAVAVRLAVLARGHAEALLERVVEVRHVVEADAVGDLRDALVRLHDEHRGHLQPPLDDVAADRHAHFFAEKMRQARR